MNIVYKTQKMHFGIHFIFIILAHEMMKPHGENLIPEKLRVLMSFLGPTVYHLSKYSKYYFMLGSNFTWSKEK